MRTFSAVIERCPDTGLLVGTVPRFPGAHSQGETLDELEANLKELISMLLKNGETPPEAFDIFRKLAPACQLLIQEQA